MFPDGGGKVGAIPAPGDTPPIWLMTTAIVALILAMDRHAHRAQFDWTDQPASVSVAPWPAVPVTSFARYWLQSLESGRFLFELLMTFPFS